MDLGRFQLGQVAILAVDCTDPSTAPTPPERRPSMTLVNLGDPLNLSVVPMARDGSDTHFSVRLMLGLGFTLGTYRVTYTYRANGFDRSAQDTFDIIAGGDPGGSVIGMASYERPEARYVVAQLSSGRIVQGKNPSI